LDRTLSVNSNLREAAHNLFGFMRELDNSSADLIIAEQVPHEGIGKAINDRLKRAAAQG
jgi:L-threonylcarbamoyladenylate synthase